MKRKQGRIAFWFLLPYLSVFFVFRFVPSAAGLLLSLFRWNLAGTPSFAGLSNFSRIVQDPYFGRALLNTGKFFLLTLPPLIVLSVLLAVFLNQKLRGTKLVRLLTIIPYVLIPAVVGIMWNWLYDNNFGILNYYLKALGFEPLHWLTDERLALVSVAIVVIWSFLGYNVVLFLAGLQGISREWYEAAYIDGATKGQAFWYITLPQLKPVLSMVVTLTLVNVVQLFDQIYVMTNGGPGTATLTLVQYMYTSAFQDFDLGYGATIEVFILAILALLIVLQNRLLHVEE